MNQTETTVTQPAAVGSNGVFGPAFGRRRVTALWYAVTDGDEDARRLFDKHYSRKRYADGRTPKLFVGPGEKMVLMTECGRALWVWRKFRSADGQQGINCAVFRNESRWLSSVLIIDAERAAEQRWPGERMFTYVNPKRVRSTNPGYCFMKAGWTPCGRTKWNGLRILAKGPNQEVSDRRTIAGDKQQPERAGGGSLD